ncbi:MAG: hypothetical protein WCO99_03090, partial [Planctomycetota bacterium]
VTSLGLIQLTRKRLGTGLVEAFSSTCVHCSGRGIVLHADPVDNASAPARKAEPGARRSRRGRKGKAEAEEPAVARVPVHVPSAHPMFKAMAAAKNGDEESDDDLSPEELAEDFEGDEGETGEAVGLALAEDLDEDDDLDEDEVDAHGRGEVGHRDGEFHQQGHATRAVVGAHERALGIDRVSIGKWPRVVVGSDEHAIDPIGMPGDHEVFHVHRFS